MRCVGPEQDSGFAGVHQEVVLTLLYAIAGIFVGFIAVVWGADRFVYGAAGLASNFGVSRLVIGLTIVAFGTSAPEMLVSGMAAWAGSREMGIGNAIGSNITNITLVLGAAALVHPLRVHSRLLLRELPVLLAVMGVAWWFLADGVLSRAEGTLLLVGMIMLVVWIGFQGRREPLEEADPLTGGLGGDIPRSLPTLSVILWLVVGLLFLLGGSRVLVWGAVGMARGVGVSELVIGLTLVALGTSLPELAASIAAARRGEHDIAVGNVVGSNIFNLLGVLGLPGVIAPGEVDRSVVTRDFPIMFGVTVLLLLMAGLDKRSHIGRWRGFALIALFIVYFVALFVLPSQPT